MQLLSITAIAIALAMDAFAVSIAAGVSLKRVNVRHYFRLSWHFGLFQALMPVLGWSAGIHVRQWIEAYDHWIAFALLAFVAQGMLRSALRGEDDSNDYKDPTRGTTLIVLSVATSIDALAVGLSLSMINVSIWVPALIIGLVAAGFTVFGMYLGKRLGAMGRLSASAELIGGIVLLLIGVKILFEHNALSFMS